MNIRIRLFSIAAFAATLSVLHIACNSEEPQPQVPSEVRLEHGLDVSCHAGDIAWDSVAAQGFGFAFVKATEGEDLKDSLFDNHWIELKKIGLRRGAYHFYVTEDDPHTQARFFIESVTLEPGDLAPVVDIELLGHNTPDGLTERFRTYLQLIEQHYGIRPIIYTSTNFWNAHLSADFGDYPLWIAEYGVEQPRLPNGWADWHVWQWKADSLIAGVPKGADLSRTNHERKDLSELILKEKPRTE